MSAYETVGRLVPTGTNLLPTSERQCRELAKLPIEKRAEAWGKVIEATDSPTSGDVQAVVKRMLPEPEPPPAPVRQPRLQQPDANAESPAAVADAPADTVALPQYAYEDPRRILTFTDLVSADDLDLLDQIATLRAKMSPTGQLLVQLAPPEYPCDPIIADGRPFADVAQEVAVAMAARLMAGLGRIYTRELRARILEGIGGEGIVAVAATSQQLSLDILSHVERLTGRVSNETIMAAFRTLADEAVCAVDDTRLPAYDYETATEEETEIRYSQRLALVAQDIVILNDAAQAELIRMLTPSLPRASEVRYTAEVFDHCAPQTSTPAQTVPPAAVTADTSEAGHADTELTLEGIDPELLSRVVDCHVCGAPMVPARYAIGGWRNWDCARCSAVKPYKDAALMQQAPQLN